MRQVPSTPRHHVRGCPAGPRSGVGVLRSRLRQPYRWCQPRSPIARREEGGIGGLRIGRRWRQGRNPAGQDESRDQDSDHGWSIPWRSGLRCAARRAASALPATCASRRRLPPAFYSEVAEECPPIICDCSLWINKLVYRRSLSPQYRPQRPVISPSRPLRSASVDRSLTADHPARGPQRGCVSKLGIAPGGPLPFQILVIGLEIRGEFKNSDRPQWQSQALNRATAINPTVGIAP